MTQPLEPIKADQVFADVVEMLKSGTPIRVIRAEVEAAKYHHDRISGNSPHRVFLIEGMKRKPTHIAQTRTAHLIDGRWYWSDGTAVDGSAMRFEEVKK